MHGSPLHHPLRFAHRGAHARLVENTLPAISEAYGLGCDGVEFDVQLSADGVPVLFHDDDLRRLAGRPEAVFELPWRELKEIDLVQNGAKGKIPGLADFLADFGRLPFYLELKIPAAKKADETYWRDLAHQCLENVIANNPHPLTFLASFHLPLMAALISEQAFSRLGAIYEDDAALAEVMALPEIHPLYSLSCHSLSADLWLQRWRQGLPLPSAEKIWLWGIRDGRTFAYTKEQGLAGLVADDLAGLLE